MSKPAGEIGHLRDEELPAVRVIVPPDLSSRIFEDDLDPGDVAFDGNRTAMLIWHERYPLGRGWRSGWVLSYDTTTSSASAWPTSTPPWRRPATTCDPWAIAPAAGRCHNRRGSLAPRWR
jgi:hypothetical protein